MDILTEKKNAKVYFIGIGGVNMSALAAFLTIKGFKVYGSDKTFNVYCERLRNMGATIFQGHNKKNVSGNADIVIINSAIDDSNEELKFAIENKLPVISRAQLLKTVGCLYKTRIGISGSHGKTTVTALIAHVLFEANAKFTAFIGGNDKKFDNFVLNGYDILLSEVCEFRKNIDSFDPDVAVTLNVDNDHLDSYESFSDLARTFFRFLDKGSVSIINADDRILQKAPKNCVTFAINADADYKAVNVKTASTTTFTVTENGKKLINVKTKLRGRHNVYNVLAAVAVARSLKIDKKVILNAIKNFDGVARRNEFIGYFNGAKCFSDYAHHPKEILSLIKSIDLTDKKGDLYFVFQPHTYSRTKILFNQFIEVLSPLKRLIIYKTYAAREVFDENYCSKALSGALAGSVYFDEFDDIMKYLSERVKKDDLIYFVGAGDIDDLVKSYVKKTFG